MAKRGEGNLEILGGTLMQEGEHPTRGPESDRGHGCQRESSRGVENLSLALATRPQVVNPQPITKESLKEMMMTGFKIMRAELMQYVRQETR